MNPYGTKLPPQAPDAEKYLLAAMLQDASAIGKAFEVIKDPDTFYFEKHQFIFQAFYELFNQNSPVDIITTEEQLKRNKKLAAIGGRDYLWELVADGYATADVNYHATLILEKAMLRKLVTASADVISEALDEASEPKKVLEIAEQKIFQISESRLSDTLLPAPEVLKKTLEMISNYSSEGIHGVRTGFIDLDKLTSGLQPGDLVVLAGRPGMGKTAFALTLMANSSIDFDHAVAFFSLEMGGEQLMQRVLCSRAAIDMTALRQGRLPKEDYPKISLAAGPISDSKIYIDDQPGLSLLDFKTKSRMLRKQGKLDLVIIDYMQLMEGPKSESRQVEISRISRGLKELAKELKIPVIALSQLSRKTEEGDDNRPKLSHLRESGAIEQDADMVWFVHRPSYYRKKDDTETQADESYSELIVAKHRNGPLDDIKLSFVPHSASFVNYSYRSSDEYHSGGDDF
jgi:replicative DNA helicase